MNTAHIQAGRMIKFLKPFAWVSKPCCSDTKFAVEKNGASCVLLYHSPKSVVAVKRRFHTEFVRDPLTEVSVCFWYKLFS